MRYCLGVYLILSMLTAYAKSRDRKSEEKGSVFKLVGRRDLFIGLAPGTDYLSLTSYDGAVRFIFEDTKHPGKKKIMTPDKKRAFTEAGFTFLIKWYEIKKAEEDSNRQEIYIVYAGPNEYVLMEGSDCISHDGVLFRNVDCTDKNVNRFSICEDKACNNNSSISKDLKFLKCAAAATMFNFYNQESRAHPKPQRGNGRGRGRPNDYDDDYYDEDNSYRPLIPRRHIGRSRGPSQDDLYDSILRLTPFDDFMGGGKRGRSPGNRRRPPSDEYDRAPGGRGRGRRPNFMDDDSYDDYGRSPVGRGRGNRGRVPSGDLGYYEYDLDTENDSSEISDVDSDNCAVDIKKISKTMKRPPKKRRGCQ